MNIDRLWMIGMIAGMAVVAFLGWSLGVSPVLAQAATASSQTASITATNASSESQIAVLKNEFAKIGAQNAKLATLRQSIPATADLSVFLQEVNNLCDANGVTLQTVIVNDAVVFQSATSDAAAASADSSTSTPTSTPTPTDSPSAAPAAAPPAAPTVSPTALITVPVKLTFTGSFENVMNFIKGIQTGQRLFFATQIGTSPGAGSGDSTNGSISGDVFALPGLSASIHTPIPKSTPAPVATPAPTDTATPGPTDTATPGPTSTPTP
jgi:Tfp pilus assembly protein PilO